MIQEKVSSYFERYPDLKILFFFDENQEFLEEVKSLAIPHIHLEFYTDSAFTTKCKLLNELIDTKVLLYLPMAHPNTQDEYHRFPLLGLLLANKELKLDNVGEFMENYGLQRHQKALVTKYMKELKYSGVQMVCDPILTPYGFEEPALQRGLISSFLKLKIIESWTLIISKILTLLVAKDDSELNKVLAKIADLKMQDIIIQQVFENTSYAMKSLSRQELMQAARCIFYNKITQTITTVSNLDPYVSFKIKDQTQIVRLNQLLNETEINTHLSSSFNDVLKLVSNDIKGDKLIDIYGLDANFAEFSPSMIWAVINSLQNQIADAPEAVIKKLDNISIQQTLDEGMRNFLKYLTHLAKLHQMVNGISSYILNSPEDYLKAYSEEFYLIDTLYRKAIKAYKLIDYSELNSNILLDDLHLALNNRYEAHTDKLNREWLKCLDQFEFDYSKIPVAKQFDFFQNEIESLNQKVVVFISDALRYEVAHELLSELHGDVNNTAKMKYMIASIPSKTNIGMAQLLPAGELVYNNGDISNSTISTEGLPNRNTILQKFKTDSLAVQYSDIIGNSQEKNRAIFKNSVVYLYHDIIDSTGDKRASERRIFDAVTDAIDEIKRLVKKLHGSLNVAKVIITADHGFLYNDREIEDKDLESISEPIPLTSHNRYFITPTKSQQALSYSIPLSKTTSFKDDVFVTIPYSVNRYRKQGVGHQFVHGGGSLQEVVVPIIESSRKREEVVSKVRPSLINKGDLKVVSNILRLNILQDTKVSRMEKELSISTGLYNNNLLVSNEIISILNSTSDSPSERAVRVELTLSSDTPKNAFLKLKIFDVDDKLNPLIEERVQNNTLIQSDF
ncbi:TIGR02687 family protein [Daejeonella rubra]|uniref:TIGR02687 family protein n=1 Tax=Daejeonella rubra TaxID=990371 RepID=A0A1G9M997_9SPHI|nr:BREX-1 system phosphatase PglZ type A [Daejeonella rubra]SDL70852.1 TIGR02687 family protein [Daejeonella rubra]